MLAGTSVLLFARAAFGELAGFPPYTRWVLVACSGLALLLQVRIAVCVLL